MTVTPHPAYTLTRLPGVYAVCQLPPAAPLPTWADCSDSRGDFCAITRTRDELSIICHENALPIPLPNDVTATHGWVVLRVQGPFDFDVVGVLAALSAALAQAGVVLLAIATYQTDYLLVKEEQWVQAQQALHAAGHTVNL
jgi:hypothetical protein